MAKIYLFAAKRCSLFAAKPKILLRQKDFSFCRKTKKSFCGKNIFFLPQKENLFAAKRISQNDCRFAAKRQFSQCIMGDINFCNKLSLNIIDKRAWDSYFKTRFIRNTYGKFDAYQTRQLSRICLRQVYTYIWERLYMYRTAFLLGSIFV